MDRGAGVPMDAGQDLWDWEVLPDQRISMGHGSMHPDDQKTEEHILPPPSGDAAMAEPDVECKDIGVVPEETKPVPSAADLWPLTKMMKRRCSRDLMSRRPTMANLPKMKKRMSRSPTMINLPKRKKISRRTAARLVQSAWCSAWGS
ncbi:unnamed protein product [Urochloa humidicola]